MSHPEIPPRSTVSLPTEVSTKPKGYTDTGLNQKQFYQVGDDSFNVYNNGHGSEDRVVYCIHGAGTTGLSFFRVAEELQQVYPSLIVCPDQRAHGLTECGNETDLSFDVLVNDNVELFKVMFPVPPKRVIIVGHSMGAAIAAKIASNKLIPNLYLFAAIDGIHYINCHLTISMAGAIKARPKRFETLEKAINFFLHDRFWMLPPQTAHVTVPAMLVKKNNAYEYRTDLLSTRTFWDGWFQNSVQNFLSVKTTYRILVSKHHVDLPAPVLMNQMNGAFRLSISQTDNHFIHEWCPQFVAQELMCFLREIKVPPTFVPPPPRAEQQEDSKKTSAS